MEGRRGSGRVEVSEGVLDEDWGFVEAGWREEEEDAEEGSLGVEEADSLEVGTNILLNRISIFFWVLSSDGKWV